MPKSKSSTRWLKEHRDDFYVQKARAEGMRSRAAFKLEEIAAQSRLLKPGLVVLDLGAAPGGFSQVAARRVQPGGRVVACDLLPMAPIPGVDFVQGDLREPKVLETLAGLIGERRVGLVISDMAPNLSGVADVDQARSMELAELSLATTGKFLCKGGSFLVKLFHGQEFEGFVADLKAAFGAVSVRKPKASRARSREVYILATDYKLV